MVELYPHSVLDLWEAKQWAGITSDTHDAFLRGTLNAVTDTCEGIASKRLVAREEPVVEIHDGLGRTHRELFVTNWPAVSVASLNVDPDMEFGALTEIPSSDYMIARGGRTVALKRRMHFGEGPQRIRVEHVAGYGAEGGPPLPADIKEAAKAIFLTFLRKSQHASVGRGELGMLSISRQTDTVQRIDPSLVPQEAREILERYASGGAV
jgi:hypothetical protein